MNRLNIAAVSSCLVAMLFAIPSRAPAATILYSWEGTIEPLDPNVDPWNIGAATYFVSASVDENAVDGTPRIDVAAFEMSDDLVFLIDGVSPTSLDRHPISFIELATRDTITIILDGIQINGIAEDLLLTVRLLTSMFSFTNIAEPPPLFPPTLTSAGGGSLSGDSSYGTFTDKGVLVTATLIPEPSTLILTLLSLSILGTRLFWRRLVVARRMIAGAR